MLKEVTDRTGGEFDKWRKQALDNDDTLKYSAALLLRSTSVLENKNPSPFLLKVRTNNCKFSNHLQRIKLD